MVAHEDHLVDLVDQQGGIVFQKLRKDIDKTKDLYHGIYILAITPDKGLALSVIPQRKDLPNLYSDRLGTTAATIRRHGESADQAAARAAHDEIGTDQSLPRYIGDIFVEFPDGRAAYISAYYVVVETPVRYSKKDIRRIEFLTARQIDDQFDTNPDRFAPTLQAIWAKYSDALPV